MAWDFVGGPHPFIEAANAAVKGIVAVVFGKVEVLRAYGEFAVGDAIGVAANGAAEIGFVGFVFLGSVVAENDVGGISAAIRNFEADDRCAVIGEGNLHACGAGEEVQIGGLAGTEEAEGAHLKGRLGRHIGGGW